MRHFSDLLNEAKDNKDKKQGGGLFSYIGGIFGAIFGPLFGWGKNDDDDEKEDKKDDKAAKDAAFQNGSMLASLFGSKNDEGEKEGEKEGGSDDEMNDLIMYFSCERDDDGNIVKDENGNTKYRTPDEIAEYVKKVQADGKPEEAFNLANRLKEVGEANKKDILASMESKEFKNEMTEQIAKIKEMQQSQQEADDAKKQLDEYNAELEKNKDVLDYVKKKNEYDGQVSAQENKIAELESGMKKMKVAEGVEVELGDGGTIDANKLKEINDKLNNTGDDATIRDKATKDMLKNMGIENPDDFVDETGLIKTDKLNEINDKSKENYNKKQSELNNEKASLLDLKENKQPAKPETGMEDYERYEKLKEKQKMGTLQDNELQDFEKLNDSFDETRIEAKKKEFQDKIDAHEAKKKEMAETIAKVDAAAQKAGENCKNRLKSKGEPGGEPKGEPGGEPKGEPGGEPKGEPGKEPKGEPGDDDIDDTTVQDEEDDEEEKNSLNDLDKENDDDKKEEKDEVGKPKRMIKKQGYKTKSGQKGTRYIVCDETGKPRQGEDGKPMTVGKKDYMANKRAWARYNQKPNESLKISMQYNLLNESNCQYSELKNLLNKSL